MGAAYGTAKSGIGIAGVGTFRPDLIMKVHNKVVDVDEHTADCYFPVSHSSGHGWNHRRLFSRDLGPDSWRPEPASRAELQSFQVRTPTTT